MGVFLAIITIVGFAVGIGGIVHHKSEREQKKSSVTEGGRETETTRKMDASSSHR